MGEAEDLVNNAAGAEVSQENSTTCPAENPVVTGQTNVGQIPESELAGSAGNAVNNQEGGVENGATNVVNHQACGAENPASDQTDVAQNPAYNEVGIAENMVNDQTGVAENPVFDLTDVTQNPASEQAASVENLLINQAPEDAEHPAKNQAPEGAEHPADGQAAGGAENSVNNNADESENALNDKAGDVNNPVNNNADGVENFVEDKADDIEIETPENSRAIGAETPVTNKADRLPEETKEILKSLASEWEDVVDADALQVIPLKGAMTNEVFQIKWPTSTGETSRKVLVRIYGEGVDVFFDRDHEIRTFEFMSKNGQGPRLLGRFSNGRVEEFIHARTLSASDLRDPSISALVAAKLKEFHNLDMPGEKKVHLWDTLRKWLTEAKHLSSPKEAEAFYLDTIDKEISVLEKELSDTDQQIGFCHNDLQYGNIMLDEETNSVTIIDYEYASYNPVAFDIANHFCEMAANYHTEEPHILDYSKYPDFEERQQFVMAYLSTSDEQPDDNEVEQLLQEIEKYTLANHLFWGVWGIISAQVNTIEFDYKDYAKQRFQEYWARKPYLLINSEARSPYTAPEGTGDLASASPSTHTKKPGMMKKMKKVLGLGLFRSKN